MKHKTLRDRRFHLQLYKQCLFLCCVASLIMGCDNVSVSVTRTALPEVPAFTPTQTPSTPTPEDTPTLTPSPTLASSSTPTLIPSETPMPALQVAEAQQLAEGLLANNANCSLPCWWGIIPGETSWSAAQSFLYQFYQDIYVRAANRSEPFTIDILIPVREEIFSLGRLVHYYSVDAGKVQLIEVNDGAMPTYKLSSLFGEYGKPSEIWVGTTPDTPSGYVDFEIAIFYPKRGIMALYNQEARQSEAQISVCLPPPSVNTLILWAPSGQDDFQNMIDQIGYEGLKYIILQEATQVSVDSFFETLSDSDATLCLDTPIELWR